MSVYTCTRCNEDKQDDDSPARCIRGKIVCWECDDEETCPECKTLLRDAWEVVTCISIGDKEAGSKPALICSDCAIRMARNETDKDEPNLYGGTGAESFLRIFRQSHGSEPFEHEERSRKSN